MSNALAVGIGASALGAVVVLLSKYRRARRRAERLAAASLESLLNAIDANDAATGRHVRRVAAYSQILARAAGLDDRAQRSVERVALFHDVGKMHEALFDIMHDRDKVTPKERRLIATHPRRGADVLEPVSEFYPDLSEGVLSHHERWDGKGYPRRLRGKRIPLQARIVSIADTFDALTHRRRYRAGRSVDDALRVIEAGRGTQFDPDLAGLFLRPDVQREIRRARPTALARSRKKKGSSDRRRHRHGAKGPDVTFRWRSAVPEPPVPDPARQRPRE